MGSNFATVPDLVSEAATFFTRFDQPKVNDLNPVDFWGSGPSYVDFHGFRVLRIVLFTWRQSIAAAVTLCKDSTLAVQLRSTF